MSTTIKEIAKLAKVSIATVSRAYNDSSKVKKNTYNKIIAIAEQLNYSPNLLAINFVKKKSNIIGLILPDIVDEFFSDIIKGVDEVSYANNYFTMVISSHGNRSIVESIHNLSSSGIIGGLIILIPNLNEDLELVLKKITIPLVIISGTNVTSQFDTISINNYQGMYKLVEHLIKKGYKKLALIEGPQDNNDSIFRKHAFIDACLENKISLSKDWITQGDFTLKSGMKACEKLLKLKNRPQVIVAANDMMAIGCYEVIKKKKLAIPKQIAVTGFDDIFVARHLFPPLTTVKTEITELGSQATKLIINRLKNNKIKKTKHLLIPTEVVIRKSC